MKCMDSKIIRIGIIGPSEIALRRFLPALRKAGKNFRFAAIGIASPEEWFDDISKISAEVIEEQKSNEMSKAKAFIDLCGGEMIVGYNNIISSPDIDAVYIPLPPALHYKWAKLALQNNKHVFVHHIVVCEHLKLTAIPKGWCVHHCDLNSENNSRIV